MVEEEFKVNPERRSEHIQVSKPGEYLISLRSQDHRGSFSDESSTYVQCHPRPLTRGLPPTMGNSQCQKIRKIRARMPQLTNVTSSYRHLQTGTDVILFEWDVTSHFNDNTLNDIFEIELGSRRKSIKVKPNKSRHYSYPYSLQDFPYDSFRYHY